LYADLAALPFQYTFAFGAIAGVTELLVSIRSAARSVRALTSLQLLYPLDVVKTRQQLEAGKGGMGMVQTFKNIVATQGYVGFAPARQTMI
jgi:solute carrier family 25 2-oxodicarboxylate transporter 21